MSALGQLKAKIDQAQEVREDALAAAEQAHSAYRNALATGDTKAAERCQKEAAQAESKAALEADRIDVLQEQIQDAEHTDNLPAFEQSEIDVHAAIEAEKKLHASLAKALEHTVTLRTQVAAAHLKTHNAILTAQSKAKEAHVDRPTYQRQRLEGTPELKHIGKIRELLHVAAFQSQLIHKENHG